MTVEINGNIYKTNPVAISVTAPSAAPPPPPPAASPFLHFLQPPDPFFPLPFKGPRHQPPQGGLKPRARIRGNLNKNPVYKWEMLGVEWILLSSSENLRPRLEKRPVLKGFWREGAQQNRGSFLGTEVIDGALYQKILMDSMILFPLETGELSIPAYEARVSAFPGFHEEIISSQPIEVLARPLPEEGKGVFSGAVGKFQVEASLREKTAQAGRPLTYRLRFEGSGHPRFIKLPPLPFPESVRVYPPTEALKFSPEGMSWKQYEILIAPEKPGVLNIPAFEITSFDPERGAYITHAIPSFSIPVSEADIKEDEGERFFGGSSAGGPAEGQKLSAALGGFAASRLAEIWPEFFDSKTLLKFWLAFYAAAAAAMAWLCFGRHVSKTRLSARELMEKRWRLIDSLIEKKDWQRAAVRLISLIYFVLSEAGKGGEAGGSANWQELIKSLPPSMRQKYGRRLKALMEGLESLSFAPRAARRKAALEGASLLKMRRLAAEGKKILPGLLLPKGYS